ncbi:hypothetical protein TorRG33x02_282450, partial [Trema orientale]
IRCLVIETTFKRGEIVFALRTRPHPLDHCCQISESFNYIASDNDCLRTAINPIDYYLAFISER